MDLKKKRKWIFSKKALIDFQEMDFKEIYFKQKTIIDFKNIDFKQKSSNGFKRNRF